MLKLLMLDVDGVLTDGSIIYDSEGREIKSFHVRDGFAIKEAVRKGVIVAVISGRNSLSVEKRCKELGIDEIYQGIDDKLSVFEELKRKFNVSETECGFMGDDIPDIPLLRAVSFSAAPSDAPDCVKRIVRFVSKNPGGRGAVREFIEYLLGGLV